MGKYRKVSPATLLYLVPMKPEVTRAELDLHDSIEHTLSHVLNKEEEIAVRLHFGLMVNGSGERLEAMDQTRVAECLQRSPRQIDTLLRKALSKLRNSDLSLDLATGSSPRLYRKPLRGEDGAHSLFSSKGLSKMPRQLRLVPSKKDSNLPFRTI